MNLQVRLTFDEPESRVTIVKLVHSDVPEEDRLVFISTAFVHRVLSRASCVSSWPPISPVEESQGNGGGL